MKANLVTAVALGLLSGSGCSKSTPDAIPAEPAKETRVPAGHAAIAPDVARSAGIEISTAAAAQIRTELTLYGSIKPNSEREQEIRARYAGVVRQVNKRAGDSVQRGDELLRVESNESLQVYPIRSLLSGRILERRTNEGDAVDSSTVLMKVADLSTVWLEFALFPRDLGQVRPGMLVRFQVSEGTDPGEARLTYIAPAGHSDSQSVLARASVDNRAGRWVPGQFVTGEVIVADAQVPVAVSPAALQELPGRTVVFIQTAKGFEQRTVQVGRRAREIVEISRGLNAGERYASRNSYLLKADLLKDESDED